MVQCLARLELPAISCRACLSVPHQGWPPTQRTCLLVAQGRKTLLGSVRGSRAAQIPPSVSIQRQGESCDRGHQPKGSFTSVPPMRICFLPLEHKAAGVFVCGFFLFFFFSSCSWNFAECFVLDQLKIAPVNLNNSLAEFCCETVVAGACTGGEWLQWWQSTVFSADSLPAECCVLGL